MIRLLASIALFFAMLPGAARAAPAFRILRYDVFVERVSISADGSTAGSNGGYLTERSVRHDLVAARSASLASDVSYASTPVFSADGSVVVYGVGLQGAPGFPSTFESIRREGTVQTETLANAEVHAVSADGQRYVGVSWPAYPSSANAQAFVATSASPSPIVTPLGDFEGGRVFGSATGISGDGQVIVGWSEQTLGSEAFRFDAASGMVGLGELEGGGFYSAATDISFDGSTIVGGSIDEDGAESVLWRDGAMLVLGDLSGAGVNSYARGVSGDGSIVVGYGTVSPTVERAYIWDAAHGMRRLDELLTSLGLDVSHYALTSATDISADGRTIVGVGYVTDAASPFFGYQVGWAAVIPEPGTAGLLASGFLGLAFLRRRASAGSPRG